MRSRRALLLNTILGIALLACLVPALRAQTSVTDTIRISGDSIFLHVSDYLHDTLVKEQEFLLVKLDADSVIYSEIRHGKHVQYNFTNQMRYEGYFRFGEMQPGYKMIYQNGTELTYDGVNFILTKRPVRPGHSF